MAANPSTYLDRRLVVDTPVYCRSLPADWPRGTGMRLRVDPPVLLDPSKRYRVALDLEAGIATVREDS